ncbi:hypothetical protein RHOER0001_4887, partial [Rhodococcus erythropolis SK121]
MAAARPTQSGDCASSKGTPIAILERLRPRPGSQRSRAVAVLGAGALAAALSVTVAVGPAAADTVTATISVGAYPSSVAISPDGGRAYVTNQLSDAVSVIDVATNSVVGDPIAVGSNPYGVV